MYIQLKTIDAEARKGKKKKALKELAEIQLELCKLQETMFVEHRHKLLIVLQGMDTAGKDGVVNHSFVGFNPNGVRVVPFKTPSTEEADHDYLWRIHKQVPGKGEIVIFNRSHYEDILFPKVHNLINDDEVKLRLQHIRAFESLLSDTGTIIIKFYLHITKDKQRERLQDRIDTPEKNWKISDADLQERTRWDDYMKAYETAINATSTKDSPWIVVPSNCKWYRNLLVARVTLKTLEKVRMQLPKPNKSLHGVIVK